MATALQFITLCFREKVSCLAHFLHFFDRQNGRTTKAFSALFSPQRGEGYFTYVVHRVVHPRVHPLNPLTNVQTKHLTMLRCAFWTWRGRGVGWNDPAFCRTVRPKGFSGVVPAHSRGRKVSAMQMSAISIP